MNPENIRLDFPILQRQINGKPIVYLDNAATALKPVQVIDAITEYYSEKPANVHRGLHKLSQEASEVFEKAHTITEKFIHAKEGEAVFTRGTTESINAVMYMLLESNFFKAGDEILLTRAEHHANLVPWQFLAKKTGAKLQFAELNPDFTLNMNDFDKKLSKKTKLVAVPHVSNTVAAINDVKTIGKKCMDNSSLFLVDAAQSVPHMEVDVQKIGCDFLAFSGHKMLGPTGIGVLYGKKEHLERFEPVQFGGAMIHSVSYEKSSWNKLPDKFEPGTPHVAGAFGLKAAIEYLQKTGMNEVREHEKQLIEYAVEKLGELEKKQLIRIHNPKNPEKQGGIILFDSKKMEAHEIGAAIDEMENIAVRTGMMCAQPMVESINPKGLCRASFYLYNTKQEIDLLAETLETVLKAFS